MALNSEGTNMYVYTCANNKARDEEPTVDSIVMTCRLIKEKGKRWRETLLRQSSRNFDLVFKVSNGVNLALGVLAETANYDRNYIEL